MSEKETIKEVREMEFDLVNNPHPHPLIYYRRGKPNGQEIWCIRCKTLFHPPAFTCSEKDCNFNIHQSCIDLPNKIHSPFHNCNHEPGQIQTLVLCVDESDECSCCQHQPLGAMYKCHYNCGFVMDVQCAIADPKTSSLVTTPSGEFRHFTHNLHPLTLRLMTDPPDHRRITIPVCLVCKHPIKSLESNYYFCPEFLLDCDSYTFHQECAELPRQIFNPDIHLHHPLLLFPKKPFGEIWLSYICFCCKNKCIEFFYSCTQCEFNLHVPCLWSFNHKHDFRFFPNEIKFKCSLCKNSNTSFPWYCTVCNLFAHESCAINLMSQHQLLSSSTQTSNLLGNGLLQHFSHEQHKLTLTRLHEDTLCDGCMRCITAMSESYACPPCGFYLHKQCATLPTKYNNSFLHPHGLSMVHIPDFVFSCAICLQYCHGFAYRCEDCCYAIDIRCATITFPFKHPSHPNHLLMYYNGKVEDKSCEACVKKLEYKRAVWCEECKFYLDVRCAHLPLVVINRFDEHPLKLFFENKYEENWKEGPGYYCDVCEEERNIHEWFYACWICCFAAHTKCIVGDYLFLKSGKYKNHVHPLNLVNERTKKNKSGTCCDACGISCASKLVFECVKSNCKFNVHASGKCYIQQLIQGQITFTMPSLRYRSISLHPDEKWKLTWSSCMKAKLALEKEKCPTTLSFLSQGNGFGEYWDDGVYSSIRAIRIYTVYLYMGIQIEYEDKDGNSIWKDIHGLLDVNEHVSTEVRLNHPDEYLTSLHGLYDMNGIQSLSFETNLRTLGPYGVDIESTHKYEKIKFPSSTNLKIVGLHGRSYYGAVLSTIGFHFIEI